MVLGYSLLRAYVAEHIQLLLVFSKHTSFLSGCAVETRAFRGTESASNRVFPQPARSDSGKATTCRKRSDNVPAIERSASKPRGNDASASIEAERAQG